MIKKIILTAILAFSLPLIFNHNVYAEYSDNSIGNLSNDGYVAYDGEYVYYSHLDSGLVKERIDGSSSTVLLNNRVAMINVVDDWLYFLNIKEVNSDEYDYGIFKLKKDGTELTQLHSGFIQMLYVVGDWIYYIDTDQKYGLYKMTLDGLQVQKVGDKSYIRSMSIYNGWIFYQYDNALYKMKHDGSQDQLLCEAMPYNSIHYLDIVIKDNWVYFNTDSTLNRIKVDGTSEETIIDKEIYVYNIMNNTIIYQDKEDNDLKKTLIGSNNISTLLNDTPIGWLYTVSDTVYYITLDIDLRESTQAYNKELIKMNSSGDAIKNIYPREGDAYYEIYDLLNQTFDVMQNVNKLNSERKVQNSTYEEGKENPTVLSTINSNDRYDISNSAGYEKIIIETDDYTETTEVWITKSHTYVKSLNEKEWIVNELTDQDRDDILNKVNNFSFIQPTTYLCNGLSISEESTSEKWVLEGEGWFEVMLLRLTSLDKEQLRDYPRDRKMKVKLIIDKQTHELDSISMDYTLSNDSNETVAKTVNISYSNINENFSVIPPSSTLQAKSKFNQAKPYIAKAIASFEEGDYEACISNCDTALNIYVHSSDAYGFRAMALFMQEKYSEAILDYNQYLRYYPEDYDIITQLAESYLYTGDYEKTKQLSWLVLSDSIFNSKANYLFGTILMYEQNYIGALEFFNQAITFNRNYEQAYYSKLAALYYLNNYKECLKLSEEIELKFGGSSSLYWYRAKCYEIQNKLEDAVNEYYKVLEYNAEDYYALTNLAYNYFYLQEYDQSKTYVEKAIEIEPNYEFALSLREDIEYQETTPEAEKIVDFVKYNYLYDKENQNFEQLCDVFAKKGDNISTKDIGNFIDSIKSKNDAFTYVISGENYLSMTENNPEHFWKSSVILDGIIYSDIEYIVFNEFTSNNGDQFIEYIQTIPNPEEKHLIIDLRDNLGGLTYIANRMLDILLPNCVTSYLVEKNGNILTYESDEYNIQFKHIYLLVNENTASSSELFTLSLKKYLDNVTVIGTNETYGKGVGQVVYENKAMNYMILLVQHYWNVLEQNINGESIQPDYMISTDSKIMTQVINIIKELYPDYSADNEKNSGLDPEILEILQKLSEEVYESN